MNVPFKIGQYERVPDAPCVGKRPYAEIWQYKDTKNSPKIFASKRPEVRKLLKIVEIPAPLDAKFDEILERAGSATVLSDPTILRVLSVDELRGDDGRRMMVLVLDDHIGRPLDVYLGSSKPVLGDAITRIFYPILDALRYAHHQQVLHGNLKPSNVIVLNPDLPSFRIEVMDFGVGRLVPASSRPEIAAWSSVTASYKAPEQHNPALGAADAASDVFAVGVMLLEMLTGINPFRAKRSDFHEAREIDDMLINFTGLPDAIADVLRKALVPDRAYRYDSADAFKQALTGAVASLDASELRRLIAPTLSPTSVGTTVYVREKRAADEPRTGEPVTKVDVPGASNQLHETRGEGNSAAKLE